MTRNPRLLHDEIPAYHLAKRARLDQLARESQEASEGGMMVAGLLMLMILGTLIALVLAKQAGWW